MKTCNKPVIKRMADVKDFIDKHLKQHDKATSSEIVSAMKNQCQVNLRWLNHKDPMKNIMSFANRVPWECSHICTKFVDSEGKSYWRHV